MDILKNQWRSTGGELELFLRQTAKWTLALLSLNVRCVQIGSILQPENFESDCKMLQICTNFRFQNLQSLTLCVQGVSH